MHYVWRALLALILLYRELFSDCELFTDRELCDTRTLAPPHVTHALLVASSVNSFPTVNSMTYALWLRPVGCMHFVWRAPLALFLLYY